MVICVNSSDSLRKKKNTNSPILDNLWLDSWPLYVKRESEREKVPEILCSYRNNLYFCIAYPHEVTLFALNNKQLRMQNIAISNQIYDSALSVAKRQDVSISAVVERFLLDWVKAQTEASSQCYDEVMRLAHERAMQKESYSLEDAYGLIMKEIKAVYDEAPVL
jgi:hypothetical protein